MCRPRQKRHAGLPAAHRRVARAAAARVPRDFAGKQAVVMMNLPATALEFLDAFRHCYATEADLPLVHCYCFAKQAETALADICARAEAALGGPLDPALVRLSAPTEKLCWGHLTWPRPSSFLPSSSP